MGRRWALLIGGARLYTSSAGSLQRDPKCLLKGGFKLRRKETANSAEVRTRRNRCLASPFTIDSADWFRRAVTEGNSLRADLQLAKAAVISFATREVHPGGRDGVPGMAAQSPGRPFLTPSMFVWGRRKKKNKPTYFCQKSDAQPNSTTRDSSGRINLKQPSVKKSVFGKEKRRSIFLNCNYLRFGSSK